VSTSVRAATLSKPLRVLQVAGLVLLFGTAAYTLFVWMPTYLTHIVKPPVPHALLINTLCMVILIATMPVVGMLADRFGYKIVLAAATLVTGPLVYPLFVWIDSGTVTAASVALTIFALTNGCIQGAIPVAMADMFPARLRFSGMAIGCNLTLALFGGTASLGRHLAHQINGSTDRPSLVFGCDSRGYLDRHPDRAATSRESTRAREDRARRDCRQMNCR
jgi:MFS transporter, MHS family, proline/betaine transporter